MKKIFIIILLFSIALISYSEVSNLEKAIEYEKAGDFKKSEKYFRIAADKDGELAAILKMSAISDEQGKTEESKKYFEKSLDVMLGIEFTIAGNKKYLEGDYEGAEKFYKEAVALKNKNAMFNLGLLYLLQEKNEEAYKYIEMASKNGHPNAKEIMKKLR